MQAFYALIDRLDRSQGDEKAALERMLWDTFGVDACVLALDMSGFSRTVRADGIIAYLAHIRRMQQVSTPIVVASGGEVVKYTADNLMAVFDSAVQAVNAAREIRQACLSMAEPLQVSIGMANGRFLWRNRAGAEQVEVTVEQMKNGQAAHTWSFDALALNTRAVGAINTEAKISEDRYPLACELRPGRTDRGAHGTMPA